MRHQVYSKKCNRNGQHRRSMVKNLLTSLIKYESIKTTIQKAKYIKRCIEPIITRSKNYTLHNFRLVFNQIRDKELVIKLFNYLGPCFKNRPGGYTRILKNNFRKGDNAQMCLIQFVINQ